MHTKIKNVASICLCSKHVVTSYKPLTLLMLDCWQREYDRRPYETLIIHGKIFESILFRRPDVKDFNVIIEFLKTRKLKNLELLYSPITEIQSLCLMLSIQNITMVSLCHIDLSSKALEVLSSIADNCILTMLRLTGNIFTKQHSENLRIFLIKSKTIECIDVGFCDLDAIQFAIVADGIQKCKSLKALNMSRLVPLNSENIVDNSKISTIISILLKDCELLEVHFKHCFLDAHDMIGIGESLMTIKLVYLDLGSNNLGPNGIATLLEAISYSKTIIGLDISNNAIGSIGGESIAHLLPKTHIRFLDIGNNSIGASIVKLILLSLKKLYPIRILNIYGNDFDSEAGEILKRQIDSSVLLLNSIDLNVTYDEDTDNFRVVYCGNDRANFNFRYHRVNPFYKQYDNSPNFKCQTSKKLLINGMYLDPISVDKCGKLHKINKYGDILES